MFFSGRQSSGLNRLHSRAAEPGTNRCASLGGAEQRDALVVREPCDSAVPGSFVGFCFSAVHGNTV